MGYYERQGREDQDRDRRERERERWQNRPRREQTGELDFEPRERPYGDESFDQDHEHWREPMEFEPRSGRLQWGGEALDRGHYPRRQSSFGREPAYPRRQSFREAPREWWRDESYDHSRTPGPFYGMGPKGYRRSDQRVLEDVNQALQDCGALDASEIEVACQNGEIVLKGSVDDRRAKRLAEEIAEQQPGVHDVRNEIRIASGGCAQSQSVSRGPRANAEK